MDQYPESALQRYEAELFSFVEAQYPDVLNSIREKRTIAPDLEKKVKNILEEFKGKFKVE